MNKVKVAVCGATGYSGIELLRLLSRHKNVEVTSITSESQKGERVGDAIPALFEYAEMRFRSLEDEGLYKGEVDYAFLCLPHEPSAVAAKRFIDAGIKVIDLSGAYRFQDLDVFEKFYRFKHPHPELISQAVYGLCEVNRAAIKTASLISNPGCFVTSALLPLIPLLKKGVFESSDIIVDSKSGFSGRGKRMDLPGLFVEQNENFYAYGVGVHRHRPEIVQELERVAQRKLFVTFTPHVLPADRGILSTIYIKAPQSALNESLDCLEEFYKGEPFVKILREGLPQLKWVQKNNLTVIGGSYDEETGYLILVSCLDNLVKGASGQALQNMNIMAGFSETEGLL